MMKSYHLYDDTSRARSSAAKHAELLTIIMAICSVFSRPLNALTLRTSSAPGWSFKAYDPRYAPPRSTCRRHVLMNLPTKVGEKTTIGLHKAALKVWKFNQGDFGGETRPHETSIR